MRARSASWLVLAMACHAGAPGDGGSGTVPITSVSGVQSEAAAETGDDGTSEDGGGSASTSGGEESGGASSAVLDVGSPGDLGDGTPAGCRGKIDFLFVVSRDGIMDEAQDRLLDAFPQFLATIQSRFADFDYHIMVVDGDDDWWGSVCNETCELLGECQNKGDGADYPCDLIDLATECDWAAGAGNVFQVGSDAPNVPCGVDGGKRYLTREQTDLEETFACIARVGTDGDGELGDALTAAMGPQLNWPGACNHGFLRDDALLMITLIGAVDSDVGTDGSSGYPALWAEAVVTAKRGDPDAAVVLAIGAPGCPQYHDRVCDMAKLFPYHHIGSITSPDYGPAFAEASALVELACAGFEAPG